MKKSLLLCVLLGYCDWWHSAHISGGGYLGTLDLVLVVEPVSRDGQRVLIFIWMQTFTDNCALWDRGYEARHRGSSDGGSSPSARGVRVISVKLCTTSGVNRCYCHFYLCAFGLSRQGL